MKLNYFTEGEAKMGKEGLILQATLGLQSCNTKKDCCEILEDIWSIALADQKAKTIRYINNRIEYCTHSANEFKACKDDIAMNQMYARVNELKGLLKEFEELKL